MPLRFLNAGVADAATLPNPADYPYQGGAAHPPLDGFGYPPGQCTSFVAWDLNERGLPFGDVTVTRTGLGLFLNASSWDAAARAAGFGVGTTPVVGAVAQWHANETSLTTGGLNSSALLTTVTAGAPGHVAVVVKVFADGEAEWAEMDYADTGRVHYQRGYAPRYLYIGVQPPRTPAQLPGLTDRDSG
jgi:surface antigen